MSTFKTSLPVTITTAHLNQRGAIVEQMKSAYNGAEAMKNDTDLPMEWRAWATATSAELSELLTGARQRETIESWKKFLKNETHVSL